MGFSPRARVALAPCSTLELGGDAEHFVEAEDEATIVEALRWAAERGAPVTILGGGSNVVIADEGVRGLVIRIATRGIEIDPASGRVVVAAGEPWDPIVALAVGEGLAGIECLSGIPGLAGATPIQNVGAYGQEVAETIESVRVLDRTTFEVGTLTPEACDFAYRDSRFKRHPDRFVVLGVTFALRPRGAPAVRYAELQRALAGEVVPTLARVRDTVIALRRAKSMGIDPDDENRRSVGSFFTNPIVDADTAARVLGVHPDAPHWPAAEGRTKLAAGWLIERAGIRRGERAGTVGVSSRHALALVHHGGGRTADLLQLAARIRAAVRDAFGITLVPEPVFLGGASLPRD